jgi:hypothetical protein
MCGGGAYFVAVFDHTTRDLRHGALQRGAWRVCVLHRRPSHAYKCCALRGARSALPGVVRGSAPYRPPWCGGAWRRQHVLEGFRGHPRGTRPTAVRTHSRTHHIIRLPSLSSAVSIARLAVKIGTPIEYLPEYREYLGAPARVLTGTR